MQFVRSYRQWMGSWLCAAIMLIATCSVAQDKLPAKVKFNEHIRPILSDRCLACHGPDENKREAELRLDQRESATQDRGDYAAIVPGKPAASELINRVASRDADVQMPPADSNKPRLTAREVALLRKWIEQGAEYESHWSLMPMQRPSPASVSPRNEQRVVNEIDRFVLAKIEEQGLGSLSPEASQERLLRRVTLDLTGVPPTPAEIDAFLADESPRAYERVVDRLLASPRYGERLAAEWLDVARYADTHGYQMDRHRPMWPYRDWVIKAFNENLPYDQFATWQLAGDLLPKATKEQRLATAFNRLHCQNEEGGIVEEEFRVAYVVDRVNTFGTAFLGLTMECSRCHDHKYDPITMRDVYSLFAFFQNVAEAGQTTYFTAAMPTPTVLLSTDEQDAKIAELRTSIARQEKSLAQVRDGAQGAFEAWLSQRPQAPEVSGCVAAFGFESLEKNKLVNSIDEARPGNAVEGPALARGQQGQAAQLSGDNGFTFPDIGHFTRADPFSFSIWLNQPQLSPRAVVFHHARAWVDAGSRGYDLLLEEGHVAFGLYHMWPGNALKVRTKEKITPGEWTHVTATYDGSSKAEGLRLYVNGRPAAIEVLADNLWKDITYDGTEPDLAIGHRFRDAGFKGGLVDEFRVFDRELTPLEAAHLAGSDTLVAALAAPAESLSAEQRRGLLELFLATAHEPWKEALARLKTTRDELRTFINPIPEAMVMQELPEPKPAFILKRGNYDQPTTPVSMDTPAALPPFPESAPRNRLGLAQWLLDPEHPLMARVTVNRYWQMLFGRGLVETSDNFGSQGATPTHPELLDWLARDFIASGWDVKALLKKMAMSATYRQGQVQGPKSEVQSQGSETIDPDNRYLWHAPPRRLSAEMLRDQALFVSGLLTEKLGGPSVKPYQPAGLWDIAMGKPHYDQSHGPDLYRRSLYTFWKRTVPPPAMMTLDAADKSYCSVRRQTTSTPLQALVLLNDPQFVEAARFAGQRMLKEGGANIDEQVAWLFRLITSRRPTPREAEILKTIYSEQRKLFAADEEGAKKLLAVGEAKGDASLSTVDLAAATVLAEAILNHDEAVYRR